MLDYQYMYSPSKVDLLVRVLGGIIVEEKKVRRSNKKEIMRR